MIWVVWLGSPFALAILLSAGWPRAWPHRYPLLVGLGLTLAFGWVLAAYLSSAREYSTECGSECGRYLGRWWEPWLVGYFAVFALGAWVVGLVAGEVLRTLARPKKAAP